MEINKLQSDFVNDQNYRCLDVWFTNHPDEEGITVAYFCEDTGKSLIVDSRFTDSTLIKTTLEVLKHDFNRVFQYERQQEINNILTILDNEVLTRKHSSV